MITFIYIITINISIYIFFHNLILALDETINILASILGANYG